MTISIQLFTFLPTWEAGGQCHHLSHSRGQGQLMEVDYNLLSKASTSAIAMELSSWRRRAGIGRASPRTQRWTWNRWTGPGFPDRIFLTWNINTQHMNVWRINQDRDEWDSEDLHLASCSLSCWIHHCSWAKRSCNRRGETTAKYCREKFAIRDMLTREMSSNNVEH